MPSMGSEDWFLRLLPVDHGDEVLIKEFTVRQLCPNRRDLGASLRPFSGPLLSGAYILGRRSSGDKEKAGRGFYSPIVSRLHAQLAINDQGHVYVTDLASLHGSSIEPRRGSTIKLVDYSPVQMIDGDVLILGKVVQADSSAHPPLKLRAVFRFPEFGSTSSGGMRDCMIRLDPLGAAERFATSTELFYLRRLIQQAADSKRIKAALGKDPNVRVHHVEVKSFVQDSASVVNSARDRSASVECIPRPMSCQSGVYGIPKSILYISSDEEDLPRGAEAGTPSDFGDRTQSPYAEEEAEIELPDLSAHEPYLTGFERARASSELSYHEPSTYVTAFKPSESVSANGKQGQDSLPPVLPLLFSQSHNDTPTRERESEPADQSGDNAYLSDVDSRSDHNEDEQDMYSEDMHEDSDHGYDNDDVNQAGGHDTGFEASSSDLPDDLSHNEDHCSHYVCPAAKTAAAEDTPACQRTSAAQEGPVLAPVESLFEDQMERSWESPHPRGNEEQTPNKDASPLYSPEDPQYGLWYSYSSEHEDGPSPIVYPQLPFVAEDAEDYALDDDAEDEGKENQPGSLKIEQDGPDCALSGFKVLHKLLELKQDTSEFHAQSSAHRVGSPETSSGAQVAVRKAVTDVLRRERQSGSPSQVPPSKEAKQEIIEGCEQPALPRAGIFDLGQIGKISVNHLSRILADDSVLDRPAALGIDPVPSLPPPSPAYSGSSNVSQASDEENRSFFESDEDMSHCESDEDHSEDEAIYSDGDGSDQEVLNDEERDEDLSQDDEESEEVSDHDEEDDEEGDEEGDEEDDQDEDADYESSDGDNNEQQDGDDIVSNAAVTGDDDLEPDGKVVKLRSVSRAGYWDNLLPIRQPSDYDRGSYAARLHAEAALVEAFMAREMIEPSTSPAGLFASPVDPGAAIWASVKGGGPALPSMAQEVSTQTEEMDEGIKPLPLFARDRTPLISQSITSSPSTDPQTPPTERRSLKRSRDEFESQPDLDDVSMLVTPTKVPKNLATERSKRGYASTVGLVLLGAAIGSMGTIAGLMQIAD